MVGTPDISRVVIQPDDLCVIVASDGLWEVFTSQEAAMWCAVRRLSTLAHWKWGGAARL